MKLHGSIIDNLESAIASARRFRGHPVYKDTLEYWAELVQEARRTLHESSLAAPSKPLEDAIAKLESELADRGR